MKLIDAIKLRLFRFRCKHDRLLPAKTTVGGHRYYMSKQFYFPVQPITVSKEFAEKLKNGEWLG